MLRCVVVTSILAAAGDCCSRLQRAREDEFCMDCTWTRPALPLQPKPTHVCMRTDSKMVRIRTIRLYLYIMYMICVLPIVFLSLFLSLCSTLRTPKTVVDCLFIAWLLVVHCRSHAPALMLPLSCSRSHAPALMLQHLFTSYPNRVFELVLSPRTRLT